MTWPIKKKIMLADVGIVGPYQVQGIMAVLLQYWIEHVMHICARNKIEVFINCERPVLNLRYLSKKQELSILILNS